MKAESRERLARLAGQLEWLMDAETSAAPIAPVDRARLLGIMVERIDSLLADDPLDPTPFHTLEPQPVIWRWMTEHDGEWEYGAEPPTPKRDADGALDFDFLVPPEPIYLTARSDR